MNKQWFLVLIVASLTLPGIRARADSVTLVRDQQAVACIVCDANGDAMVQEAAQLASRIIQKSTGVQLAVGPRARSGMGVLRITATPPDARLDKDGYVISSPGPGEIVVAGGSPWGALFGTQELLDRYLGVRWLFPGDAGEYVPRSKEVAIPRRTVRDQPAFFSRQVSGHAFAGSPQQNPLAAWLLRQRMHGRMAFHHSAATCP